MRALSAHLFLFLLLLFAIALNLPAQMRDSSHLHDTAFVNHSLSEPAPDDDEFNVFLSVVGFVGISLMIGIAAAGALVTLLLVGAIAVLAAAGVVSASLAVGLYKRSVKAGFRTAVYILLIGGGIVFGVGALWLGNVLFHQHYTRTTIVLCGAIFGGLGGWLSGWSGLQLFSYLLRRLITAEGQIHQTS